MSILVDLSQVMLASIAVSYSKLGDINEDDIRHMILNSIRTYRTKFSSDFGEMILCCDSMKSWRREVFPYYKANRKRSRDESKMDWKKIFGAIDTVRDELRDNFPYRLIRVDGAEGDDIIGTLVAEGSLEEINNNNRILIVSGDRDYGQLQKFPNVEQYDPVNKRTIKIDNPRSFLMEHIIKGDVGDGVPNILSADDCLVKGVRQTPVMSTKLNTWLEKEPEDFCTNETMLRNFRRNEKMIDLSKIPDNVRASIMSTYESQGGKNTSKVLRYFLDKKLSKLMEHINDF